MGATSAPSRNNLYNKTWWKVESLQLHYTLGIRFLKFNLFSHNFPQYSPNLECPAPYALQSLSLLTQQLSWRGVDSHLLHLRHMESPAASFNLPANNSSEQWGEPSPAFPPVNMNNLGHWSPYSSWRYCYQESSLGSRCWQMGTCFVLFCCISGIFCWGERLEMK